MNEIYTIIKIIFLPIEFYKIDNNQSFYCLLKNTGYFDMYWKITENAISEQLIKYSHCIEDWIYWSENKRTVDGWYLKKDNNKYVVGNIILEGKGTINFEFEDAVTACSIFIKNEIENTRKNKE